MEVLIQKLYDSGYPHHEPAHQQVAFVLRKFAEWFPFENLDVLNQSEASITPAFLLHKMVTEGRGGLCYEINPLLYLVLDALGFHAELGAGTVHKDGKWATDRTHAFVLLNLDGTKFIADSGFGSRLSLTPLQLDGPAESSSAGTFRLRTRSTARGSIALESSTSQEEMALRYAFDWEAISWEELDVMKRKIHDNPQSAFNKELLIASLLHDGTLSINERRLHRKWTDGRERTIPFASEQCLLECIAEHYHPSILKEARKLIEG